MTDSHDSRGQAGGASRPGPPAYPMIEMRKRLMWAEGEIARLKDESRIGWLERALEREQQLRRDAEHHLATLQAYCDTQPYPEDLECLRSTLEAIAASPSDSHDEFRCQRMAREALSLDASPSISVSSEDTGGAER